MSDFSGGYKLNKSGLAKVERSARGWASKWRNCFDGLTEHDAIDAAYKAASSDRNAMMPDWLESDDDFQTFYADCRFEFNLETACDAAHEKIDPNYFAEGDA